MRKTQPRTRPKFNGNSSQDLVPEQEDQMEEAESGHGRQCPDTARTAYPNEPAQQPAASPAAAVSGPFGLPDPRPPTSKPHCAVPAPPGAVKQFSGRTSTIARNVLEYLVQTKSRAKEAANSNSEIFCM